MCSWSAAGISTRNVLKPRNQLAFLHFRFSRLKVRGFTNNVYSQRKSKSLLGITVRVIWLTSLIDQ